MKIFAIKCDFLAGAYTNDLYHLKNLLMKRFAIINALIWASVILTISFFAKELPEYKYIFGGLVFASGLQVSLLNDLMKKEKISRC